MAHCLQQSQTGVHCSHEGVESQWITTCACPTVDSELACDPPLASFSTSVSLYFQIQGVSFSRACIYSCICVLKSVVRKNSDL